MAKTPQPGVIQRVRNFFYNPAYSARGSYGPNIGLKYQDWEHFSREYNLRDVGNVGPDQGMGLTDVYTCINILSQSIAWLPKSLKRKSDSTGTETLSQNPLNNLVALQPNGYLSAYNFWTMVGVNMWGWGNHYSVIQNRSSPNNTSFLPLDPWRVTPKLVGGELFYDFENELIPSHEMLHFRLFTKNGIDGISPIRQNAALMGFSLRQQEYSHNVFGTKPTGVLMSDVPLEDEVKTKGGETFKEKILNGEIPVLDRLKYMAIGIPPEEAQYLQTAKLASEKIYGMYRVPQTFGQNYEDANFANSEQQSLNFAVHTLMPPITNIEQELKIKLLPSGSSDFFHVQANALLRGDTQTRKEFYQTLLTLGVYSPKRVLELEDEPWTVDDDVKYIQGAMIPIKDAGKQLQNQNGQAPDPATLQRFVKAKADLLNEITENGHS